MWKARQEKIWLEKLNRKELEGSTIEKWDDAIAEGLTQEKLFWNEAQTLVKNKSELLFSSFNEISCNMIACVVWQQINTLASSYMCA